MLTPCRTDRPFLLSYGGGHAQIIIAVARELGRRGIEYDLLGLTTAHAAFVRAGLASHDICSLLPAYGDDPLRARGAELAPASDNPDVSLEQARAYYALGYEDLVVRFGAAEAERRIGQMGRKAFEPVTAFRRHFSVWRPSVVVTTTSPRAELAAIKAARELGITSVAIGDMYLIAEQEWILGDIYADHLIVMSDDVREMLESSGRLTSKIHVLGNPVFDALAHEVDEEATRADLRRRLGIEDHICILWPLGGAADEVAGRRLLSPRIVAKFLERLCAENPRFRYIMRPHPNWPVETLSLQYGQVDSDLTLEQALLVSDLVCVEASTVGLQAVLRGKPTICLSFADYVIYPRYGWAAEVDTLEQLRDAIVNGRYFAPPPTLSRYVGGATSRVADLIQRL